MNIIQGLQNTISSAGAYIADKWSQPHLLTIYEFGANNRVEAGPRWARDKIRQLTQRAAVLKGVKEAAIWQLGEISNWRTTGFVAGVLATAFLYEKENPPNLFAACVLSAYALLPLSLKKVQAEANRALEDDAKFRQMIEDFAPGYDRIRGHLLNAALVHAQGEREARDGYQLGPGIVRAQRAAASNGQGVSRVDAQNEVEEDR